MANNTNEDQLFSLIYVSSARVSLTETEIEQILMKARQKNKVEGISGMLLYKGGNFLQVLEGPEPAVTALMEIIRNDNRHHGILVLQKERISSRRFGRWEMAFTYLNNGQLKNADGYSNFLETSFTDDAFRSRPEFAYRMLLLFKESMR